jgi:replicative superfamily II helicase
MQIEELIQEGLPKSVIDLWQQQIGPTLLPVQARAVRKGVLQADSRSAENGSNYLICAPTSSGKSFCAEMAAVRTIMARRRVIWLTPLRSLARQICTTLEKRYADLNLRSLIVSGDEPNNDRPFLENRYDVAVVIYEKADALLTARPDRLAGVGLVVADEVQLAFDPDRGAVVDRLLTRVKTSRMAVRLLGLSATLDDRASDLLARWLDADLISEATRPVDLLCGVAAAGNCRFRSFNTGKDHTEVFPEPAAGEDNTDFLLDVVKDTPGPALVFLKSRQDTVSLAFRLSGAVSWPPARTALDQLAAEEPSFLIRALTRALQHGVAFHSADLTRRQREIVEQAFMDKEVRAISATTTLALGVNLPAQSVFMETVRYDCGPGLERPVLVPISRQEFDNMAGRAGRLGCNEGGRGRAVLLAESEFEREVLWENYIRPNRDRDTVTVPHCGCSSELVLNLIVSNTARSRRDLETALAATLSSTANQSPTPDYVQAALEHLVADGFVRVDRHSGHLEARPLGRAVACKGLSLSDALRYRDQLDRQLPESQIGWLALAATGRDWRLPSGFLSASEMAEQGPLRLLYERFDHALTDVWLLVARRPSAAASGATGDGCPQSRTRFG